MLEFFSSGDSGETGLSSIRAQFCEMLDAGLQTFETAARVLLGDADASEVRKDLFKTERRIDEAERKIRRELVVHASVHGISSFPRCLVLMSIVKDAERLGDYASNIFDLAVDAGPLTSCDLKADLFDLKSRIMNLIAGCQDSFKSQDKEAAVDWIAEADAIEDHCDEKISLIIDQTAEGASCAACALAYRYFKRTASHALNILTSIVQPVDMLDFTKAIDDK